MGRISSRPASSSASVLLPFCVMDGAVLAMVWATPDLVSSVVDCGGLTADGDMIRSAIQAAYKVTRYCKKDRASWTSVYAICAIR